MRRGLLAALLVLLPSVAWTFAVDLDNSPLDLRIGQTREWVAMSSWPHRAGDRDTFDSVRTRLRVLESAIGDSGTDWRILVSRPDEPETSTDTAILTVFEIADSTRDAIVCSSVAGPCDNLGRGIRLRNLVRWTRTSRLFPLDWQVFDDSLMGWFLRTTDASLFGSAGPYAFLPAGRVPVQIDHPEEEPVLELGLEGEWLPESWCPQRRCWNGFESSGCDDGYAVETRNGVGVVRWLDRETGQLWLMRSLHGNELEVNASRLTTHPVDGETWVYAESVWVDTTLGFDRSQYWDRSTHVLRVLGPGEERTGWISWSMSHIVQGADGRRDSSTGLLRLDTLRGRVVWQQDSGSVQRWPSTTMGALAMGFLDDWSVESRGAVERARASWEGDLPDGLRAYESSWASTWQPPVTSSWGEHRVWFQKGLGPIRVRVRGGTSSSILNREYDHILRLVGHSLDGSAIQRTSSARNAKHDLTWLRERLATDPSLEVSRVLTDGSRRTAHGAEALRLLDFRGPAVFVVRDGNRRYAIPSARF